MKELLFGAVAVVAVAGGIYFQGGAIGSDVYPLSAANAQSKLANAQIVIGSKGPFGHDKVSVSIPSNGKVLWISEHGFTCEAIIEATGEDQSRVNTSCNTGEVRGNAIGSTVLALRENGVAELVDATLDGRPYEADKVDTANSVAVIANQSKMVAQTKKTQQAFEAMEREIDEESGSSADDGWAEDTE